MDELERKTAEEARFSGKNNIIVILDDVRSMNNVGSVFRTSDAFAVNEIYLCGFTPTPPHRDIHKTALGATESVLWSYFEKIEDAVNAAKQKGYKIAAVEQAHNSISLRDISSGAPVALIFGNEVNGVNADILKQADMCVEIPQWGAKHSLNIAVSTGVVLWELVR